MSYASRISKILCDEAISTPIPQPVGTKADSPYVPNPNDAKGGPKAMDIEDSVPLARRLGAIIDSLDDDDISEELADIVEKYLEQIDSTASMTVEDAARLLPLEDCQDMYEELVGYLTRNGIDYSEGDVGNGSLPSEIPLDLYPSSSNMIMGGSPSAPSGSFNLGN